MNYGKLPYTINKIKPQRIDPISIEVHSVKNAVNHSVQKQPISPSRQALNKIIQIKTPQTTKNTTSYAQFLNSAKSLNTSSSHAYIPKSQISEEKAFNKFDIRRYSTKNINQSNTVFFK